MLLGFFNALANKIGLKKYSTNSKVLSFQIETDQFGNNIFKNDIVKASIDTIAKECSKFVIRSVIEKDSMIKTNNDSINRLFSNGPNSYMSTSQFLYFIASTVFRNNNCFIYPEFTFYTDVNGEIKRKLVALHPLITSNESVYLDASNNFVIKFTLKSSGEEFTMPYDYLIHLKNFYDGENLFFGQNDNEDLLKNLQNLDKIKNLTPKAIEAAMGIKGVMTAKTRADAEKLTTAKNDFEKVLQSGETSIAVLDVAGEFHAVNINPVLLDSKSHELLLSEIYQVYGISKEILMGTADSSMWASFYQKTIEPFEIQLSQALTKVLYTERELAFGNKIKIYDRKNYYWTVSEKLEYAQIGIQIGAVTANEYRALFGNEPIEGGDERLRSLNYVNSEKANDYQGVGSKEPEKEDEDNE